MSDSGAAAAEVEVMVVDDEGSDNVVGVGIGANISFTHDLADRLEPLKRILPPNLAASIPSIPPPASPSAATTHSDPVTTSTLVVPHSLLYSISKWTRTEEGATALLVNSLNPRSYEMVSLLAGSITSPERKFPSYRAEPDDPLARARQEVDNRKAIATLINALLSIGGSGAATWYAAGVAGWQNEWRALFSLFFALLVAIAEGVLFILWNSRRSTPKSNRGRLRRKTRTQDVDVKIKVE